MATAYTSLLGLALPVTGELQGTWGTTVNDSITSLLDTAVAGTTTLSADTDVTLSTTTGAANQARQAILLCSGARTVLRTITAPAQSKIYTVINATTGGFSVKLVGVGPTTGVTIVAGESALVAWNGSDFIKISNTGGAASFTNVTVSGTTTLSGLTASTALALNGSKEVVSVTNTGTGNNVLSASPTLTGTISAAAATLSGNLTLSGGTANGVLYLDGSKVATSGTALAFSGTSLTVGAGSGNPFARVNGGTSAGQGGGYSIDRNGTEIGGVYSGSWYTSGAAAVNTVAIGTTTTEALLFGINYTEQMRLTSTGLGIGTSSPQKKLAVSDAGAFGIELSPNDAAQSYNRIINYNRSTSQYVPVRYEGSTQTWFVGTAGTTRAMDLDSSGNLGLGVTPSAWLSTLKAMQIGPRLGIYDTGSTGAFIYNAYINSAGNAIYSQTAAATLYDTSAGLHRWYTAPSGTAGNTISFTQAMTLDASGNLLLGTNSTDSTNKLQVAGRIGATGFANTNGQYAAISASILQGYPTFGFAQYLLVENAASNSYGMSWHTTLSGTQAEKMRLDSSGNLGIGTSSPGAKLDVYGGAAGTVTNVQVGNASTAFQVGVDSSNNAQLRTAQNVNMLFYTNATERARITSGGDLQTFNTFALWPSASGGAGSYSIKRAATNALTINDDFAGQERLRITSGGDFGIGNNNPQYRLTVDKDTTSALAFFTNSNASAPNGLYVDFSAASPNNATQYFLYCEDSTAQRATIRSNGGLANYQSNNVDLSDSRTKKDIAPAASMWSKIGALEIVTYKYNDQTHDDVNVGVIAQQVEQVEPMWVDSDGFGETPEDGVPLKTVYTKDITFAAIKALQEAMTRIEQLEARVAALEAA